MSVTPTPPPNDLTGKRLGKYEILARIASGGMASVYLSRARGDEGFSRLVAIKVLHRHLIESPDFVAMFRDEARIAARVANPNVVDVYDVTMLDGELIIAMQYVEGASLHALRRVARKIGTPLPVPVALRILVDALRGLHAAHELVDDRGEQVGLVHRDFSPQNVLVGADGLARVADFGVAKARGRTSEDTRTGVVKGKLRYLAPEQLQRGVIDRRVDIFAAGIVLWEALAGETLFQGSGEAEILMGVLHHPIAPPSSVRSEVALAVDRVCLRALERDASRRFATALEFADALEEAAAGRIARASEVATFVESLHRLELERLREAARKERAVTAPPPPEPEMPAVAHTQAHEIGGSRKRWVAWAIVAMVVVAGGSAAWFASRTTTAPHVDPPSQPSTLPSVASSASVVAPSVSVASTAPPSITKPTSAPKVPVKPKPSAKPSTFVPSGL